MWLKVVQTKRRRNETKFLKTFENFSKVYARRKMHKKSTTYVRRRLDDTGKGVGEGRQGTRRRKIRVAVGERRRRMNRGVKGVTKRT